VRIFGYVLLAVGILLAILFAMAELGGGQVGIAPFVIALFLVSIGWRLRTYGSGITAPGGRAAPPATPGRGAQAGPGATSGTPDSARATAVPTVEIPMTPEAAAAIARQSARSRRLLLYVVAGGLLFFLALGVATYWGDADRAEGRTLLAIFSGAGVAFAVLCGGISWLTTQWPVQRDLRLPAYLRTTGPLELVSISGGYMLRLADRAFLMNGRAGSKELSGLNWATVDHTPHGHVLLAAWNREGVRVYAIPGYDAGLDAAAG